MKKLPKACHADIVVQELGKEILIYNIAKHKAYNLNETSTTVYNACDGETSFDELKEKHGFTDELIFLALDELKKEKLIEVDSSFVSPFAGVSRREAIKRAGLSSLIALPLVLSLTAPTIAQTQSGFCSAATCVCVFDDDDNSTTCSDKDTCGNCTCQVVRGSNSCDETPSSIVCTGTCVDLGSA